MTPPLLARILAASFPLAASTLSALTLEPVKVEGPNVDVARETVRYQVISAYQPGTQVVEVLLPPAYDAAKPATVVYLLPVEPGVGPGRWGDAIAEVKARRKDLPATHQGRQIIYTLPGFATAPWYGDNPKDPQVRYESYLVNAIVPLMESRYLTPATPEGRVLVGFSKSGFGAFSLIFRNPDVFGYACSWDAPLLFRPTDLGLWKTDLEFGTTENLLRYLPVNLARERPQPFKERKRLVLLGHANFGDRAATDPGKPHTEGYHDLLVENGVLHEFNNTLVTEHSWNWTWLGPAIVATLKLGEP